MPAIVEWFYVFLLVFAMAFATLLKIMDARGDVYDDSWSEFGEIAAFIVFVLSFAGAEFSGVGIACYWLVQHL
jgi:hypothetical protein